MNRLEELRRRQRGRRTGRGTGAPRPPAPGGQALRARAHRAAARRKLLRRDGQAGDPPLPRFRHGRPERAGRRLRHRLRPHRRPPGLRLRPGFHRPRRLALRDQRPEDLQDHGPGHEDRRARDRPQRFRRRAHPGGRRSRWPATPISSCATPWPAGWCRRSPPSWALAPAERSTRPPSPISSSWWTTPATCSSPARTSSRPSPTRTSPRRSWAAR